MTQSDAVRTLEAMGLDPQRLRADPAYRRWLAKRRSVNVDGQMLYLHRGDHLADEDQILLDWAAEMHGTADQADNKPLNDQDYLDIEGEPE